MLIKANCGICPDASYEIVIKRFSICQQMESLFQDRKTSGYRNRFIKEAYITEMWSAIEKKKMIIPIEKKKT